MPGKHYASGDWRVNEGSEEEFVARWQTWLSESARSIPGFGTARLLRDAGDARHFISFSDWGDPGSRDMWRGSPSFAKGFAACRELCEDFQGADLSQVASVSA